MSCGLLDLACHAQGAVSGLFDWLLGFFDFRTLVMLWVGTAIGAKFGWSAFIAETFGLLALFGRRSSYAPDRINPEYAPERIKRTRTIFDAIRRKPTRRTAKRTPKVPPESLSG